MSEPKVTLDYQPPPPANRGKIWLILGILVATGFVLAIFGALGSHVHMVPTSSSPTSVKFVSPSTMPAPVPTTSASP